MADIDFDAKSVENSMTNETKSPFNLLSSEQTRLKNLEELQTSISAMYSDLATKIDLEAQALSSRTNISSVLRKQYLEDLSKEIKSELKAIKNNLSSTIEASMKATSNSVLADMAKPFTSNGVKFATSYFNLSTDVVGSILNGDVYEGDWNLSKALWSDYSTKAKDINLVIAEGIAANKSSYDIAKDLEKYVDPAAKKDWNWSKVYPTSSKKVDYNAQRLARTLTSHAYQQSIVQAAEDNPLVEGIKWRSAEIHGRTCELCKERNGKVYEAKNLPLDHPNGLCTFLIESPDMDDIAERLANWTNGKADPALDKWLKNKII